MNGDGICVVVNDQCKTHGANGLCESCFVGYDLVDGQCVFSPKNLEGPSDKGCKTFVDGICS